MNGCFSVIFYMYMCIVSWRNFSWLESIFNLLLVISWSAFYTEKIIYFLTNYSTIKIIFIAYTSFYCIIYNALLNNKTYIFTSHDFSWLQKGQLNCESSGSTIFLFGGGFLDFFYIYSGFFCEIFSASLFRLGILWDKNQIKVFCSEIWVKMFFGWPTFKSMCNTPIVYHL
jgi:hypothetical protein